MSELLMVGEAASIPFFDAGQVRDICRPVLNYFRHQLSLLDLNPRSPSSATSTRIFSIDFGSSSPLVLFLGHSGPGEYSIELVIFLFALVLRYSDAAFMISGNHEINGLDGFGWGLAEGFHSNATRTGRRTPTQCGIVGAAAGGLRPEKVAEERLEELVECNRRYMAFYDPLYLALLPSRYTSTVSPRPVKS
jgi:hypothetical protein